MADTRYLAVSRERAALESHIRRDRRMTAMFLGASAASAALLAAGSLAYAGIPLAIAVALAAVGVPFAPRTPIPIGQPEYSGMIGEDAVLAWLRGLDDRHFLFRQLYVPNPRSRSGYTEIDAVVVGPGGVFTAEVKNHSGMVLGGDERAREWCVRRMGRRGRVYETPMRNPVRQARVQGAALAAYLRSHGHRAPVFPMVVLSHPWVAWRPGGRYSVPVVVLRDAPPVRACFRGGGRLASAAVQQISGFLGALPSGAAVPPGWI